MTSEAPAQDYEPQSEFLRAVIAEEVPLSGTDIAEHNFRLLLAFAEDADRSNRDWAVLLVAQQERDDPVVRATLLRAAEDSDQVVRAEAFLGLAQRDMTLALPFIRAALSADSVSFPIFEAAELAADPSLVDDLRAFACSSDNMFIDNAVLAALAACERASV